MNETYESPLESRYASSRMRAIWSARRKFTTWRRLWLALAESQRQLGLDIASSDLEELAAHLDDIDFEAAQGYEARFRHDVMAHIHAFGDVAPGARRVLHLGATSQYVNCNTDLILIRDGLTLVASKIAGIIDALATFAIEYRDLPTLGLTHLQPAQPTTVGKRACVWAYDLVLALEDIEYRLETLRFRGAKGTTGTQASFLSLFDGDETKVERLDALVTEKMGWPPDHRYVVTGQTYPRIVDAQVVNALAVAAAALHKITTDLRLLAGRREIEEPFEASQVGSSAMPYKRNPMRCERACALARFVMTQAQGPLQTAATQWMERTLDDSAIRRIALPESFLALDGALDTMANVSAGLVVHEKTIRARLMEELPFMAAESILMAAVRRGADRQSAHEVIRQHSHDAAEHVAHEGAPNDLLDRLAAEPIFEGIDLDVVLDPTAYVGRAPEQVDRFIDEVVEPVRARYVEAMHPPAALRV